MNKLGIDIGKVIMAPIRDGKADTTFLSGTFEDAMRTPPAPRAFEAIKELVDLFENRVWLVSKCGPRIQKLTRQWLAHWDFYRATGVPEGNLRFCLKRPEKAHICSQLRISHFIDDRIDVLECMNKVRIRILFGEQKRGIPEWARHAPTWDAVLDILTASPDSLYP